MGLPVRFNISTFANRKAKLFEKFLDEEDSYGGMITSGGLDFENCEDSVTYEPVPRRYSWQFKLSGVSAGSYSANVDWYAESDTGTFLIWGPAAVISAIAKELGSQ
ncbi:hypothetical protein ANCDUO_01642, partial [Ancylostoma duodenale]